MKIVKSLLFGIGAAAIIAVAGAYATAPPPKPATAKVKTLHAYIPMSVFGKIASAIPIEPIVDSGTVLITGQVIGAADGAGFGGITAKVADAGPKFGHGHIKVFGSTETGGISRNHPS